MQADKYQKQELLRQLSRPKMPKRHKKTSPKAGLADLKDGLR